MSKDFIFQWKLAGIPEYPGNLLYVNASPFEVMDLLHRFSHFLKCRGRLRCISESSQNRIYRNRHFCSVLKPVDPGHRGGELLLWSGKLESLIGRLGVTCVLVNSIRSFGRRQRIKATFFPYLPIRRLHKKLSFPAWFRVAFSKNQFGKVRPKMAAKKV